MSDNFKPPIEPTTEQPIVSPNGSAQHAVEGPVGSGPGTPYAASGDESGARPGAEPDAGQWAQALRTQAPPMADDRGWAAPSSDSQREQRGSRNPRQTNAWRRVAIGGGSVLASAGLLYGVAYATAGTGVPRGTSVLGVDIGGLGTAEAEQRLAAELPGRVDQPITVQRGEDGALEIVPSEAGLGIDYKATVMSAGGGGADPVSLFQRLFGGGPVEPVVAVDRTILSQTMTGVAETTNSEASDGAISFEDGKPVVTEPVPGVSVDVAAAGDALVAAFPGGGPIELPVESVDPAIGAEEVDRALHEFAEPAMSGLVTLIAEGKEATVGPKQLSKALTMVPTDGKLVPRLDGVKLQDVAEEDLGNLGQKGRDATIKIENGSPTVVSHQAGRGVTPEKLSEAVLSVLTKTGDERAATLTLETIEPKLTTEQAGKLGVKQIVASFTTHFPHAEYRNINIGHAAELIDNTLLEPDEVFSLNGLVGERTAANGFTDGSVIKGGRLRKELGGGVSQLATTTFNAAWFAGLADVEHRAHGLYFPRYPMGREATVWWPTLDLKFGNNTPYGVVVDTVFRRSTTDRDGSITVNIWSTKYWSVKSVTSDPFNYTPYSTLYDSSGENCVPQTGTRGFDVRVTRTRTHGDTVKTDKLFHRYSPADQIYCREKPSTEATQAEPDSSG